MTDTAPARTGLRSRRMLLLMVLGSLCVALPFMGWQATWFGRRLSNREIDRYLGDDRHPRKIQHALSQISDRIQQGDAGAARWYPRVVELSRNPFGPHSQHRRVGDGAGQPLRGLPPGAPRIACRQ